MQFSLFPFHCLTHIRYHNKIYQKSHIFHTCSANNLWGGKLVIFLIERLDLLNLSPKLNERVRERESKKNHSPNFRLWNVVCSIHSGLDHLLFMCSIFFSRVILCSSSTYMHNTAKCNILRIKNTYAKEEKIAVCI